MCKIRKHTFSLSTKAVRGCGLPAPENHWSKRFDKNPVHRQWREQSRTALAQLATNCIHKKHCFLLPLSPHTDSRHHPPLGRYQPLDAAAADWPDLRVIICPNIPPHRDMAIRGQASLISGGQGAVTPIAPDEVVSYREVKYIRAEILLRIQASARGKRVPWILPGLRANTQGRKTGLSNLAAWMRRILYQAPSQAADARTHLETQRMGPIGLGRGDVLAVWQRIARPRNTCLVT